MDQGMGGGKSHACIGAYHLAAHPVALLGTDLGAAIQHAAKDRIGTELPTDLGNPHVVVMACDNMTPFAPDKTLDGPAITLYERFLWRLFAGDYSLYARYKDQFSSKSAIGDAIGAIGRPVLIIIDEIVDYIGNGLDGADKPELAAQDMAFLRALLDVVNDIDNAALIMVMIDSEADSTALSPAADKRRADLHGLLVRNGTTTTVTEVGDFADILRRRLFEQPPVKELVAGVAAQYSAVMNDAAWDKHVWSVLDAPWRKNWDQQVADCYPFHPMLIGIARTEWAQVVGFQRVRSTIRIFAATVYALQQRGKAGDWVPPLIGPGDLPLSDNAVREALLFSGLVEEDRTRANYRSLAENEIVNSARTGGTAWTQDDGNNDGSMARLANPHPAERAATFIFLSSIIGTLRPGLGRGASEPEVKAATSVPDTIYTNTDADLVVANLVGDEGLNAVEIIEGHGKGRPRRYFLSTRLTYKMLVGSMMATITDSERDQAIADKAKELTKSGPFARAEFVAADLTRSPGQVLATAGIDDAHKNRLLVLDPAQYSLRNGMEAATVAALKAAMGLDGGEEKHPVQWAASAVFAVVNTQRRAFARRLAKEYLARERALATDEVQGDEINKQEGQKSYAEAKTNFEQAVKRAYQHVAYLAQPDPDGDRSYADLTFDEDNMTALDGTAVWKALASADKALDAGQLTVKGLLHNLREKDYGRSLAEIRDSFYNAPRLPLLHGGDADLKQAIYDAVNAGQLRVIDGAGAAVTITAASQVNLASTMLRLAAPIPVCPKCGIAEDDHVCAGSGGAGGNTGASGEKESSSDGGTEQSGGTGASGKAGGGAGSDDGGTSSGDSGGGDAPPVDKRVDLTLAHSLLGDAELAENFGKLFRVLYTAADESAISYLQGSLTIVAAGDEAERIAAAARTLGIEPKIKDN
ncbi:DUF499 domain-containing protein [Gordonia sihwensis]|uniref:DUF499 domain-containing protein n=1 Tax=Gordonia sihwensis TaxID=173559 RepID=UPI003D95C5E4